MLQTLKWGASRSFRQRLSPATIYDDAGILENLSVFRCPFTESTSSLMVAKSVLRGGMGKAIALFEVRVPVERARCSPYERADACPAPFGASHRRAHEMYYIPTPALYSHRSVPSSVPALPGYFHAPLPICQTRFVAWK